MGLFTTVDKNYDSHYFEEAATAKSGAQVETGSTRQHVLVAHAIGTLSNNPTVTDDDMELPTADSPAHHGHQLGAPTICLHSLAVLPAYQGRGLGRTLLRAYVQRLRDAHTYKRMALLADSDHVAFYLREGFRNVGSSKATFGETAWSDMVSHSMGDVPLQLTDSEFRFYPSRKIESLRLPLLKKQAMRLKHLMQYSDLRPLSQRLWILEAPLDGESAGIVILKRLC